LNKIKKKSEVQMGKVIQKAKLQNIADVIYYEKGDCHDRPEHGGQQERFGEKVLIIKYQ
jgi:hypothetical protein